MASPLRRSARTPRKPVSFVPGGDPNAGDFHDGVPKGLLIGRNPMTLATKDASKDLTTDLTNHAMRFQGDPLTGVAHVLGSALSMAVTALASDSITHASPPFC